MSTIVVRFLGRPGCHLCDDARPLLMKAAKRMGVSVVELDIDQDDALLSKYGMRIPVILDQTGGVVAEGVIADYKALRSKIERLTSG